ncbi:chromosomal segregation and condensation complex, ScpB protein [Mycoplasmopsis californica]|uniref:Segregation and condensation protein B n=1 Tax=Mycoplasmopsis equigenitalium TaxID=114883 RepID=A0ABY5J398_9BACT|nr:SMC-Scp complex subunit ScpB [Mycoplasmopsis equigenitalium]UUD37209.1 SMC-Scp complex subunit ScpB [Mycoplasmopsis equigenitalium]VEU69487.1 chromosomal segregation and condensation complex, ScpB protein [Mycoplasmopsis californica]
MRNKIIEALLYIQGDQGLSLEQIKEVFDLMTIEEAKKVIKDFISFFNQQDRGLKVVNFNDVYKLATRETVREAVEKLVSIKRRGKLTAGMMEVVGIVAYKQPITRGGISKIRGVDSNSLVQSLIDKKLIEEVGKSPTPGTPALFGVTNKFYDYFKLKTLSELPKLAEFEFDDNPEANEGIDLFSSQRHDQ